MKCNDWMYVFFVSALLREIYSIPDDVMPYPQFFLQPNKQAIKRETQTTIDCGAYGGIGQLTYTYYKGTSPQFSMMTKLKTVQVDPETQIARYTIDSISSKHKGYYQCVVSDDAGVMIYSNVVYLDVIANYLTRVQPITRELTLLSTTKLHILNCTMPDSSPPAWPQWFRNGVAIKPDDPNMFVSYGSGYIDEERIEFGDLVLYSVSYEQSAQYTCAAVNYMLTDNQIDIAYYNVTVTTSGAIGPFKSQDAIVSDQTISVGERGFLFCGGIGDPSPETEFLTIEPPLEGVVGQMTRLVVIPGTNTTKPNSYFSTCRVANTYFTVKLIVVEPAISSVDSVQFTNTDTSPIVYYEATDEPPRTLSCDTTAEVAKQWFLNGQSWTKGPYHETDLKSGFDLISNDIRPQDSGVYQCRAFSDKLAVYRTQILCVVKQLKIETISPVLRELEGRYKKLTCSITGSPTPTMLWLYNAVPLIESDNIQISNNALNYPYSTTLLIRNVTLASSGKYECQVSNYIPAYDGNAAREDAVSATIDFRVVAPVHVTTPNNTVLSFADQELVLQCTVYGEPKPSKPVWRHQGRDISELPDVQITYTEHLHGYTSNIRIQKVSLNHQGNYTCTSTNFVDAEQTAVVTISVPIISPVNVTAPKVVEIEREVEEYLTCTATGHPPAERISWFFKGEELSDNINTTLDGQVLTSVLYIQAQSNRQGGRYSCNSTNNYLENYYYDTAVIIARFVSAVSISAAEPVLTGVYGKSLTLVCNVFGEPLPDEIRWETGGYHVSDSKYIQIKTSQTNNKTVLKSELTILSVVYSTETLYNCTTSNYFKGEYHDAIDSIAVIVEFPVMVTTRSQYAYNTQGKPVDVECEVEGKPLPDDVLWFFTGNPGQEIAESQYYTTTVVSRDNIMNATLRINALSPALIGDYKCYASNVVDGIKYEDSKVVNVDQVRQVIVSVAKSVVDNAKRAQTNLTCYGEGVPPPQPRDIEWMFNGTVLPKYSLKYLIDISEERIYKINSVLRISDTQLSDEGAYTCKFSNRDRTNSSFVDEKTIQLNVQVPVEVKMNTNFTVELKDGESATITCNIYARPAPSAVSWVRSKTGDLLSTDPLFNISTFNISANQETLTSLLVIRAMSLDLEGTYECSAQNTVLGETVRTPAYKKVLRVEDVTTSAMFSAVSGEVGKLARLVCSAAGVPMPADMAWFYCGAKNKPCKLLHDADRYTIIQDKFFDAARNIYNKVESTLTIKMVRWGDRGSYTCRANNVNQGSTTSSESNVVLNVGQAVSVNTNAQEYQTLIGTEHGMIVVQIYGFPVPAITWQHNDAPMVTGTYTTSYITVEEYSGVSQLSFENVNTSHGGQYALLATNKVFNTTYTTNFTITVNVAYKPVINLTETYDILEMTTDKIPCRVASQPSPSGINWFYNNTNVMELSSSKFSVDGIVIDDSGDIPVSHRSLVIKQARLVDSGMYTCEVRNLIGKQFQYAQKTVLVSVVSAAVVTTPKVIYDIAVGAEINLTCIATGYPTPREILWFHNGTLISTSDNVVIVESKATFKERISILWVKEVTYTLYGVYECTSSNIVLGSMKTDKSVITVQEGLISGVSSAVTSQELLIIIILSVIILIVVVIVVLLLFCRQRRRQNKKYREINMGDMPSPNGADSTLKADSQRTALIQIDPSNPNSNKIYKEVEYAELDPRVYKSEYTAQSHGNVQSGNDSNEHIFKPMPRKKRSQYATIDVTNSHLI